MLFNAVSNNATYKSQGYVPQKGVSLAKKNKVVFLNAGQNKPTPKKLSRKELENTLDIYSYSSINSALENLSKNIAKIKGNKVFYIPESGKSYDILAAIYKTNNPNAIFITGKGALQQYLQNGNKTNIIILDDCIGSGLSVIDVVKDLSTIKGNVQSITSASIVSSEMGVANIHRTLPNLNVMTTKTISALEESPFFLHLSGKDRTLLKMLLNGNRNISQETVFADVGLALQFPYMAPNINSPFAAQMLRETFCGPECAIKNTYLLQ